MAKPPKTTNHNQIISAQWTGPLPPPAALEKFDQLIPGGADRILSMAEQEQAHRIDCEKQALPLAIRESKRGQYMGVAVCLAAIAGAVIVALLGGPWQVAVALVGVPVLGAVQAFLPGRNQQSKPTE